MHSTKIILVTAITVLAGAFSTLAAPLNFNEVSLWVRAKETDKSIQNEVKERKLAKALTPQQEAVLKSQGASDSLIQSLRNPAVIASPAEIAATEVKTPAPRNSAPTTQEPTTSESPADNFHVFEVASGPTPTSPPTLARSAPSNGPRSLISAAIATSPPIWAAT